MDNIQIVWQLREIKKTGGVPKKAAGSCGYFIEEPGLYTIKRNQKMCDLFYCELLLNKCAFNHVVGSIPMAHFFKAALIKNLGHIFEHGGATAQHEAVLLGVDSGEA